MSHKNYYSFLSCIAILILGQASMLFAQGPALMVNPKRIVFEGAKRNDIVTLFNSTDDSATYAVSWQHYEMLPNGKYKDADSGTSNVKFCDTMIRFFPREVTLGPHESQTVRLQFLRPKNIENGEYRSHLYFRGIERVKPLEVKPKEKDTTLTVQLRAIYGLSIPIIVRSGTKPSVITLTDMTVTPLDTAGRGVVSCNINRAGDESSYGSFFIKHKDDNGKETLLGYTKGVACHVPLTTRTFSLDFKKPKKVDFTSGTLVLEYQTLTGGAKETLIASASIPLRK